jgi:predicted nuclease with TOPRIM domain
LLDISDAIVAAVSGGFGSLLTYLSARSKNKDDAVAAAQKFWVEEMKSIREEMRGRIKELTDERQLLESRVDKVEGERELFRRTLARCNEEKDALTGDLTSVRRQLHEQYKANEELKVLTEISLMGQERASGAASGAARAVRAATVEIKEAVAKHTVAKDPESTEDV